MTGTKIALTGPCAGVSAIDCREKGDKFHSM